MVDLIIRIDQFVCELEDEGFDFAEILPELRQYVEIAEELDGN